MIFNSISYTSLTRYTLKKQQQQKKKTANLEIFRVVTISGMGINMKLLCEYEMKIKISNNMDVRNYVSIGNNGINLLF